MAANIERYASQGGVSRTPFAGAKLFAADATADQVVMGWDGGGKVIIVTGCSTGLGKEAARVLAAHGAEVIMAVRDTAAGEQAAEDIRAQHPTANLTVMACDLSSLASVQHFTESFIELEKPCHAVMANAGVMGCPFTLTAERHEMQFGTNHLGHFALVQQLLPLLKATGQQSGQPSRVVVLSSAAHFRPYPKKAGGPILLHSLDNEQSYDPLLAYGQSKLCNVLFMRELSKRLQAERAPVIAVACHPGLVATGVGRHVRKGMSPVLLSLMNAGLGWMLKSIPQGAATQVYLCTAPDIKGGEYYVGCHIAPAAKASLDAALGAKLWALSEELVEKATTSLVVAATE